MTFSYKNYEHVQVEGKRIYQVEDRYYPSITTVLGATLEPEKAQALDQWRARVGQQKAKQVSNDAATRGTNTHLMLERALRGEDPRTHEFPDAHAALFHSLRLQLKRINKVYGQEVVLFSDVLGVAGRCDLVAEHDGLLSIVDYKTSTRVKTADEIGDYWLQAAFYATAHNEMFGTQIDNLVVIMGVENHLPLVFKKKVDDGLLLKLAERVAAFYARL